MKVSSCGQSSVSAFWLVKIRLAKVLLALDSILKTQIEGAIGLLN